jgi:hypothetical protein
VRTASGQCIRNEATTPAGLSHLIATLGRLARLMRALEDLARYGGPAMLSESWSRISELLRAVERLAHAGACQPSARQDDPPAVRLADHLTRITERARVVDEHAVGSGRCWLAVHTLGQRGQESYPFLAGLTAEPSPRGRRPLWPG